MAEKIYRSKIKKIVSIVGARPQFIKVAPLSKLLRHYFREVLIHTGQHYDDNMSKVFFADLNIPTPDYHLGVGSGPHGIQTGKMLAGIEQVLLKERPALVIVFGDTNSTLAGVLAAAKLHIPVAHVEAGLRSFNREMPEEINRVVTDHLSSLLFAPTETAVLNLRKEGITHQVHLVGDVMADALATHIRLATERSSIVRRLDLKPRRYILATIHRAENTDHTNRLREILAGLSAADMLVILPLHPRTKAKITEKNLSIELPGIRVIDPVGYWDMLVLEKMSSKIVTDSGGIQKEAYLLGVPCITLRDESEWLETVEAGWNIIVGANREKISHAIRTFRPPKHHPILYPTGASDKIVRTVRTYLAG